MQTSDYQKAIWLTLVLVVAFVVGWELYWRLQNHPLSYNDDESLWASTRKHIYKSSPARPVLIGSSRIKFDLDLDTWERITGQKPIQLSLVGTSPRPVLTDLGNDKDFRGTLLIDVTEGSFFSPTGSPSEKNATKRIKAYPNWSLSQQISFQINRVLEANLLFLDEQKLSLVIMLNNIPIKSRAGVNEASRFPREFSTVGVDRQTKMTDRFLVDTSLQNQVKKIWETGSAKARKKVEGPILAKILKETKQSVDQIRLRGGQVLFIRTPSDGLLRERENKAFPRNLYWDRLLSYTKTPGIYFEDYPPLTKYRCPEWSHLSPKDAILFTKALIPIVEQETGWTIQRSSMTPSKTISLLH